MRIGDEVRNMLYREISPFFKIFPPAINPALMKIPIFVSRVQAGFPSPADDYIERPLDLNEFLIRRPAATFFVRVAGDSMTGAGINSGDILIVDRSEPPVNKSVIIAVLNGELTVKRLIKHDGGITLLPENDSFQPIEVPPESQFEVWGVVIHVIHSLR